MSVNATVLAVCVNWNGQEVLAETLSSLLKSNYPLLDVLVVDNDSRDGSLACIPPSVKTLRLRENRGYGAALNAAVRLVEGQQPWLEGQQPEPPSGSLARPDYYLMLNNDMVLEESMVGELVQFALRKGKAILGPKILRYDEPHRLEAAWGRVDWSHVLASYQGKGAPDGAHWSQPRRAQLLLGSALLLPREVFEQVGLFDENFFMYHEEVDFLYRAGRKGYPIYHCPSARAWHHGQYGTRKQPLQKVFWTRRNAVYFLRKHRAGLIQWGYFYLRLVGSLLYNLALFRWERARIICQGMAAGWKISPHHK